MSTMEQLPDRTAPDSQWLYGFWYRAMPGEKVGPSELQRAHVLDTPLVIGRDLQGRVFAMNDACPHRGMPLSCGWFDGEQVECSYHGWKFDAQTGQCQLIPSLTADQKLKVDRIYAGSYPCEEHDRYIWVFLPEPPAPGLHGRQLLRVLFPKPITVTPVIEDGKPKDWAIKTDLNTDPIFQGVASATTLRPRS